MKFFITISVALRRHARLGASEAPGRPQRLRGVSGHPRGQALAEFALVAPLMFGLLLGIVDVGLTTWKVVTWQQQAGTAASLLAAGAPIYDHVDDACTPTWEDDGVVLNVTLTCSFPSVTTVLPGTYVVSATAPML